MKKYLIPALGAALVAGAWLLLTEGTGPVADMKGRSSEGSVVSRDSDQTVKEPDVGEARISRERSRPEIEEARPVVDARNAGLNPLVVLAGTPGSKRKADETGAAPRTIESLLKPGQDLSDPGRRAELVRQMKALEDVELQAAYAKARRMGLPVEGTRPGGGRFALIGFDGDTPLYQKTENVNAAISTAANLVRSVAPYDVNGSGWTMGIWEVGGVPRVSHQEFGSPTRVTVRDGTSTYSDHATHVAGTMAAQGVNSLLLGMAPGARLDAYSSTNAFSEMTAAGAAVGGEAGKIYVSNHSYGLILGWEGSDWYGAFTNNGNRDDDMETRFGRYDSTSASYDSMLLSLPYYLPFYSSGNNRNDDAPSTGGSWYAFATAQSYTYDPAQHPQGDGDYKLGYDTLDNTKVCKNVMTIGAVNDAVAGGVRNLAAGTISSFSSAGPTDDGRIKPDVVANGVGLLSAGMSSDTDFYSSSGTSMSSPNAAGSAMLLVDYYTKRFPGQYMRSSTLKGLIIHTADDIGRPGPDYFYGWGLMNTKAAADHIARQADENGYNGLIEAGVTTAQPSDTYNFRWNGVDPIRVTLCWTDPAGTAVAAHDDRAKDLINDLNLTVTGPLGSTHLPFVMPYVGSWSNAMLSANATTGVNTVDNVEQVLIQAPPAQGVYTVTVNHAGGLSGGSQAYSLIISGQLTDDLEVTPSSAWNVTGQFGGPMNPLSRDYTLVNEGPDPLDWMAEVDQPWLALSLEDGSLEDGESEVLTVSLTSAVNSLPVGTHTASLTVTNVVTDVVSTRSISLTISPQTFPTVISPPADLTVIVGEPASFSVTAAGGGISYQWQKGTTDIPGANARDYTLPATEAGSAGSYRCVLTNNAGTVNSASAVLTVITPPVIEQDPSDSLVDAGANATFTVSASGLMLGYQWQKNGVNLTGRTQSSLTINGVTTLDDGAYRCVVSNPAGSTPSNAATLAVNGPPGLVQASGSLVVNLGEAAAFSVTAAGPGLSYQWQKNPGTGMADIDGAVTSTLNLPATLVGDTASYRCRISNVHGTIFSAPVTLTVVSSPVVTSPAAAAAVNLNVGLAFSTSVQAQGLFLNYQWRRNDVDILGATSAALNIGVLSELHNGSYTCRVWNTAGQVFSPPVTLLVVTPPVIVTEPEDALVNQGDPVTLSVTASGPLLSYQWWYNGLPVSGATGSTHQIASLAPVTMGRYYCRVSNSAGSVATRSVLAGIIGMPVITLPPYPVLAEAGSPVRMEIVADGSDLDYAWKLNGKPAGTGSVFAVWPYTTKNGGIYVAEVKNSLRTTTSSPTEVKTVTDMNPALDLGPLKWSTSGPAFWRPAVASQARDGKDALTVGNISDGSFSRLTTRLSGPVVLRWWQKLSTQAGQDFLIVKLDGAEVSRSSGIVDWQQASLNIGAGAHELEFAYVKDVSDKAGADAVWLDQFTQEPVFEIPDLASRRLVPSGSSVTLEVSYTGAIAPDSYQWRLNGKPIKGAAGPQLLLSGIQGPQAGAYDCVLSSTVNGLAISRTGPAHVVAVVDARDSVTVLKAPGKATFKASAFGQNLRYQWRKGTVEQAGQDKPVLELSSLQYFHSGEYICEVRDVDDNKVDAGTNDLRIYDKGPRITHTGDLDPAIISGPYSFEVAHDADVRRAPVSFKAAGLPKGLVIHKTTGEIFGVPDVWSVEPYKVVITATNGIESHSVETRIFVRSLEGKSGTFTGLIPRHPALNRGLGGRIDVVISSTGTHSGTLVLGASKHTFKARIETALTPVTFDVEPEAGSDFSIARGKEAPLRVSFTVADPGILTGAVKLGDDTQAFTGWKAHWSKTQPADTLAGTGSPAGLYNFQLALPPAHVGEANVPQGTGFGSFVLDRNTGAAVLAGKLADNASFTSSTLAGAQGQLLLYSTLYAAAAPGSLAGVLDIQEAVAPDDNGLTGPVTWWRPAAIPAAKERMYPSGFADLVTLQAEGGRYVAPVAGALPMGLTEAGSDKISLAFLSGGIGTPPPSPDLALMTLLTSGKTSAVGANPRNTSLTLVPGKGTFSGGFLLEDLDPLDVRPPDKAAKLKRAVSWQGLLIRHSTDGWRGGGFFILPELPDAAGEKLTTTPLHSGEVKILPVLPD